MAAKSVMCGAMGKAALALLVLISAAVAGPALARPPVVVVELYTAQGCSSCIHAGKVLADLGDKPPALVLTFGVDIWDYLGWRDTFAKPEFSARQRAYMGRLNMSEVYTPQVVIDGRYETAAVPDGKIAPLIKQAAHDRRPGPRIRFSKGQVEVGHDGSVAGRFNVWLIRYEPHDQTVIVKDGENHGQTVIEPHVVRQLVRLGAWRGGSKTYDLPEPSQDGLDTVVLVQGAEGGPIIAVGEP